MDDKNILTVRVEMPSSNTDVMIEHVRRYRMPIQPEQLTDDFILAVLDVLNRVLADRTLASDKGEATDLNKVRKVNAALDDDGN